MLMLGTRFTTTMVSVAGREPALPGTVTEPTDSNAESDKEAQSHTTGIGLRAGPSPICPGTVAGAAACTAATVEPTPTVTVAGSVATYCPAVTVRSASSKT